MNLAQAFSWLQANPAALGATAFVGAALVILAFTNPVGDASGLSKAQERDSQNKGAAAEERQPKKIDQNVSVKTLSNAQSTKQASKVAKEQANSHAKPRTAQQKAATGHQEAKVKKKKPAKAVKGEDGKTNSSRKERKYSESSAASEEDDFLAGLASLQAGERSNPLQSGTSKTKQVGGAVFGADAKQTKKQKGGEDGFEAAVAGRRRKKDSRPSEQGFGEPQGSSKATSGETELVVEPRLFGIIIGPKGDTLKKIQTATGATVNVPKAGSEKQTVTLAGPPEAQARAAEAIKSLLAKGFSPLLNPDMMCSEVTCPLDRRPIVIGKNGATRDKLQEACNVRITLPPKDSTSTKVQVTGLKKDVLRCKDELKSLIKDGYSPVLNPGFVKIFVEFPPAHFNFLIGPRGQSIKTIKSQTGCEVSIPAAGEEDQRVRVVGLAANAERARKQILGVLAKLEEAGSVTTGAYRVEDPDDPMYEDPYADPYGEN